MRRRADLAQTYAVTASGAGMANWGTATIAQRALINNFTTGISASAQGGGIQSAGVLSMTNTPVSGNYAGGNYGSGIHLIPSATSLALVNVTITDNEGGNLIGVSTGCTMAGDLTGVLSLAGSAQGKELRRNSLEASCHPRRRRVTAASAGDTAACSYLAGLGVVACAGVFGRLCFASHAKIDSPASSATRLL